MSLYFFVGSGNGVTLNEMGHLVDIINYYEENYIERFYAQIIRKSIAMDAIMVVDDFNQSYDFSKVLYSYRNSTIQGGFAGEVIINSDGTASIIGRANFDFIDEFKDPISIAQLIVGIGNYFSYLKDIPENQLNEIFLAIANINQRPYPISDGWTKNISITLEIE